VAQLIVQRELTVAQTEAYVEGLLSPAPRKVRPTYVLKDVRLFLNTVNRAVSIMNAAGVKAECGREETDAEILLTIHIPK
jgi:ParB family chromosome partitioning protein